MEKKKSLKLNQLCRGLPIEFAEYMRYVTLLCHKEIPDYSELMERFRALANRKRIEYDNIFDWTERAYLEHCLPRN